jgi:hypothetical protein
MSSPALLDRRDAGRRVETARRVGAPRARALAVPSSGLVLVVVALGADLPALLLAGLVLAGAAMLRRWLPLDVGVPAATLALTVLATAAGVVAGWAGVDLLARPWLLGVLYLAGAAGSVVDSWRRPGSTPSWRPGVRPRGSWVLAPAVLAALTGLVQAVSLPMARSWAFFGTDLVQHMTVIRWAQETGSVDYGVHQYPQGFHVLAALLSVPGRGLGGPLQTLDYDLRLMTSLTWLLLAVVLWSLAVMTVRVGGRLGLPEPVPSIAAVVVGLGGLVTSTFVNGFVYLGGAPALLGMVALLQLPLVALVGRREVSHLPLVLTGCLCTVVLGHVWQALVLAPAVACVALLAPRCLDVVRTLRTRQGWWRSLRWGSAMAGALVLAAVPVLELQKARGLSIASVGGDFPGEAWHVLAPGVLGLAVLRGRLRERWARLVLGTAVGLAGTWVLVLAGSGMQLHQWYPTKASWFLAVLLAPFAGLLTVRLVVSAGRWLGARRHGFVLRGGSAALVAAGLLGFWVPHMMSPEVLVVSTWRPAWSHDYGGASTDRYEVATSLASRLDDDYVFPYFVGASTLFDPGATRVVSGILTFLSDQPQSAGDTGDVCAAVRALSGGRPTVVASRLPPALVERQMAEHGCAGTAEVVRVPGAISDVDVLRH